VAAQKRQLVQLSLEHLRPGRGSAAAQPRRPRHSQVRIDVEHAVQLARSRWLEQRREPLISLGPRRVPRGNDPAGQRIHGRTDDSFGPQPVAGQLQQHARRVVLERPGKKKLIQ